jgi:small subunit ribosomal protein S1
MKETNKSSVMEQEEVWVDSIDALTEDEYSEDQKNDMLAMYDSSLKEIREGEIIEGRIVNIGPTGVAVDIGFKSEGLIPLDEFDDIKALNRGDVISVFLESVESSGGHLDLSKKKADFMMVWEQVQKVHDEQTIVQGKCLRRVKGGIVVDLFGIEAFLPGSQIDVYPVRDFDALIGQTMDFKIVKLNELRKNIVLSRKIILEKDLNQRKDETLKDLQVGDVVEAIVKNITDFGVFVDINGLDGLIYITDLSWGRVNHPSEVCKLDETINIQILDIDYAKKRVSAGLKQLTPHPWDGIEERFPEGSKVNGKVVSITDYGAFIEIEKGIEGLIHVSEMSWVQHVKHPSAYLHLGDQIEAIVLNIKKDEKKISLGLKQLEPDPWAIIEKKYPVGTTHKGIVRSLTQFGAFVELQEGIDGLVHISDLSWTKKLKHPKEVVKKGEEIEVQVLDINKDERRIALGHKQTLEDPWEEFEKILVEGYKVKCKVTKKVDKGLVVDLEEPPIEGFAPKNLVTGYNNIAEGAEMDFTVDSFNKELRKVIMKSREVISRKEIDAAISNPEPAQAPKAEEPAIEKPAEEAPAAE